MKKKQPKQLIKYMVIGLLSNAAGYSTYLLLTHINVSPKAAMTTLYITIATLSFFGNKKITFSHSGKLIETGIRYITAQAMGYLINLFILVVFVDELGYNHKIVQAIAIITVACFLFITLKLFVFRRTV